MNTKSIITRLAVIATLAIAGTTHAKNADVEKFGAVTTEKSLAAIKPGDEVAVYCTSCNTISLVKGAAIPLGKTAKCPACGAIYDRESAGGNKVVYRSGNNGRDTLIVGVAGK